MLGTAAAAAPAPAAASTHGTAATTHGVSAQTASAQARKSHKDVQVTAATTPESTLTAHPNGTFTVNESLAPVRKFVGGVWKSLDATLHRNSNGTISTAVTSSDLTLSGGGSGPLATLHAGADSLAVSLPAHLPTPSLSGATATYPNVFGGVDLAVTANTDGTFSDVLIVKNAKAAANPALKNFTLGAHGRGVTITSDRAGNIKATDRRGHPIFTATTPQMWDSKGAQPGSATASSDAVKNPMTGQMVDRKSGTPVASTVQGPGRAAHATQLATRTTANTITLTPKAAALSGSDVTYPVFLSGPTFVWPSAPGTLQGWTYTSSYYSGASFWKTNDLLRVGYTDDPNNPPNYTARSYLQIGVPSAIYGAEHVAAQLNITEVWSWSCTPSEVDLDTTSGGVSSSTTWANQPAPKTFVDSQTVAYGWGSNCANHSVPFTLDSVMQAAADSGTTKTLTFVLKATDTAEQKYQDVSWKKFDPRTTSVSITYDHLPNTPTHLTTSPSTSCTADTIVGDGNVTLYAGVSDPDGGTVGSHFQLLPHGASSPVIAESSANNLTNQSGSTSVFIIPKATLEQAAGGKVTEFDWRIQVSDFGFWGNWLAKPCHFSFDPTRPGPPNIVQPGDSTIGQSLSVTINPPTPVTGVPAVIPSSYEYQVNGGAPLNVKADANGVATVTIKPRRQTNVLSVSSLSAGANYGDSASINFFSEAPTTVQSDGDLSGDNIPDLLTVGGQDNLPSGLWLANAKADPGQTIGNGHLNSSAPDIGPYGSGINANGPTGAGTPADYDGALAITGHFTGTALQDVLIYYPSGTHASVPVIINGNGDGSALDTQYSENDHVLTSGKFADPYGNNPMQLVNAGNTSHSGIVNYPDLLSVSGDTSGYGLNLIQAQTGTGSYSNALPLYADARFDALNTPDKTADWNMWTLTSTQLSTGTAMFLWNKSTGQLDLWENLAATDIDVVGQTATLTYTDYPISKNFTPAAGTTIQAADVNSDGIPDLRVINPDGSVTTNLYTDLTATPITPTQYTDALTTPSHSWPLNDGTQDAISNAADVTGNLAATGSGGATWTTGDLFSPSAHFDGTGVVQTTSSALNTTGDFTISAWVKPEAFGGRIIGQSGTHTSPFALYSDATTKSWQFEMARSDATNPTEDVASAVTIPAQLGTWVRLTATYQAATGRMVLYVDDVAAAQATHTTKWNTTGPLTIGAYKYNDAITGHFVGSIADVQTYSSAALSAKQVAILAGNPGPTSYEHINDNHDFGGDGTADVVAQWGSDGTLHLYDGAAESDLVADNQLWDGTWASMRLMTSGNFTDSKDDNADIVAIWNDGTAHLYTGDGRGHIAAAGQLIGGGTWLSVSQIAAADFTGDGHTDLLAIWNDGSVHIYPGDGNGHIGSAGPNIWNDNSWKTMRLLGAGDYNNDGHADLLGVWGSSGDLYLYNGDGNGHLTQGVQMTFKEGSWATVKGIVPGDFTDDGLTDLVAVWGDGTIHLYTGDGTGTLTSGPSLWEDDGSWKTMGLIS
ncbi:FG-GAP-like repeat-containing protein [Actinacidiphila acidipaludis]|uniref:FG-GAP-like repeat-containing protein n=1 Tax=Actinacidiphila acidipaludis TaxID=2873382 RepID=A0ABS7QFW6_9ACTN|nr:FG-GAP-like repeat-containing protein [Streptomyces acidipaludis]MBY8881584.1 FG-GAP-like repeat-containing protein [Streptomyces acidipaludis]